MTWLIGKGVDIERTHAEGTTPLIGACFRQLPEIVAVLLAAGANVAAETTDFPSATALSAAGELGNAEIANMLLNHASRELRVGDWARDASKVAEAKGQFDIVKLIRKHAERK